MSRVINAEPGVTVDLQQRVGAAVDKLGYRHDLGASVLRRNDRKTATIGMILDSVANPFASSVQRAVEDLARERNILALAASSDEDPNRERELARVFAQRRIDGLILMPTGTDQSYLAEDMRNGMAVVCVDRPAAFLDTDAIVVDNVAGVGVGAAHLIRHGHRRIAFLGDLAGIATARDRRKGYEAALATAGIVVDPRLVHVGIREEHDAEAAVVELLASVNPPTAVFTARNSLTIGAMRALRRLGLAHTVALVGFDDIPLGELIEPGLTVIAQDPTASGLAAAEALLARLDGATGPTEVRIIPTRLIERGSGEIAPAR